MLIQIFKLTTAAVGGQEVPVAVKAFKAKNESQLFNELHSLQTLEHPNVLKIIGVAFQGTVYP